MRTAALSMAFGWCSGAPEVPSGVLLVMPQE
jgi:hypothetical protein